MACRYLVGRIVGHPGVPLAETFRCRLRGARVVTVAVPALVVIVTGAAEGGRVTGSDDAGGVSVVAGTSAALVLRSNTCRPGLASLKPLPVRSPIAPVKAATQLG